MSGPDDIEGMLRARGAKKRRTPPVPLDVDDVRRRGARQTRRQQLTGVAAVALVLGMGAVAATARPSGVSDSEAGSAAGTASGAVDSLDGAADTTTGGARYTEPGASTSRAPSSSAGTTGAGGESPSTTKANPSPAPTTPPTTAAGKGKDKDEGRDIRKVNFRNGAVSFSAEDCDDDRLGMASDEAGSSRRRPERVEVSGVSYGNVAGDAREDAVVTVACGSSSGDTRAFVFSVDASNAAGVRRVAAVAPSSAARWRLVQQGVVGWQMASLSIAGDVVESAWTGRRSGPRDGSCTFTLRQRWTGSAWEQLGAVRSRR